MVCLLHLSLLKQTICFRPSVDVSEAERWADAPAHLCVQSLLPLLARGRLQLRRLNSGQSSRSWCDQVESALRANRLLACRSGLPWCAEAGGYRSPVGETDGSHPFINKARACCRVLMWVSRSVRLGETNSCSAPPRRSSHWSKLVRASSKNSNGTGRPVFCLMMMARFQMPAPLTSSSILILTRSQPRSCCR